MNKTTQELSSRFAKENGCELSAATRRFWNWVRNEANGENELYLYGTISDETWWGDEVTPTLFKSELKKHVGDVTVWLNSPGGDVFAASQIYTMLRNHKGKITVKIDGIAASAASVVAMAGDETLISPTGMLMIHNPMTFAAGNKAEMEKAITLLEEVKETILNAYEQKSHLSRAKLSHLMDEESWFNAKKALQLGFVDGILFSEKQQPFVPEDEEEPETEEEIEPDEDEEEKAEKLTARLYSTSKTRDSFLQKVSANATGTPITQLEKRLSLLKY